MFDKITGGSPGGCRGENADGFFSKFLEKEIKICIILAYIVGEKREKRYSSRGD